MANSAGDGDPGDPVEVVVSADAVRAGREVRARLDAGSRAAGFVGDESADADSLSLFVADVLRPPSSAPS